MYRKYCDRCRKLIPAGEDKGRKYIIERSVKTLIDNPNEAQGVHLCPKCYEIFMAWLESNPELWTELWMS